MDGIPVMLLADVEQTHGAATQSLHAVNWRDESIACESPVTSVHPYVQTAIVGTNGNMYRSLVGRLTEYPIPDLMLPRSAGALFLDIGCNWGRWCIAAGRQGYYPVGIDPSLEAVRAAREVATQLGVSARYVVGDARFLPFRDNLFDVVFSYSVLQHFSWSDAKTALQEVWRVVRPGGRSLIQMANSYGPRSLYHQVRRRFREPRDFEVRYWTPAKLIRTFGSTIGPSVLSVDGILTLNPQRTEAPLLPWRFRTIVKLSMLWRRLSVRHPALAQVADSLYVSSYKPG
jgi:SAM-dependent methyltransferase